jgi:hypothetical protein
MKCPGPNRSPPASRPNPRQANAVAFCQRLLKTPGLVPEPALAELPVLSRCRGGEERLTACAGQKRAAWGTAAARARYLLTIELHGSLFSTIDKGRLAAGVS